MNKTSVNTSNNNLKSVPIFLAFLCMGFGDVVGPLTGLIKECLEFYQYQWEFIKIRKAKNMS